MVRKYLFCIRFFLFFISINSGAQVVEYSNLLKLPSVINGPSEELMPLLSPDGKKLYFSRAFYEGNEGGLYAGQDIWVSEKTTTGWNSSTNDLPLNNKNNNVVVGFGKNEKTIYYTDASPYRRMNGVNYATSVAGRRVRPELLAIPGLQNMDFIGFHVSRDLDVIFLSMKGPDSKGNEDLYYSSRNDRGEWSVPKSLGTTINSNGFEIAPFLSPDKKRLYFASNGHGGNGDADIFYSERLYDSWETWSVPVNLGAPVNSPKFDAYFSIYGDSVAFFASNREGKFSDLYQVDVVSKKTILSAGQRYLTSTEWGSMVGANVSQTFIFPANAEKITPPQAELLFYIVNKLMLQRDIQFHLRVLEEESPDRSKKRLQSLVDELKKQGIDAGRIYTEQVDTPKKSANGLIELRLFR